MAWCGRGWAACLLVVVLMGRTGGAQSLPQTTDDALREMSQMADVIFAGQVAAVRRYDAAGGATGVVEIDFAVEDAVSGVSGGSYTLREWAGLWMSTGEPFRVGQKYLMLLHAPGAAGLSSPVGGMDGAIPIRAGEAADVVAGGLTVGGGSGSTTSPGLTVDLGWVATRVVRPVGYGPVTSARPVTGLHAQAVEAGGIGVAAAAGSATAGLAVQRAAYGDVVGKLKAWKKEDHHGR